MLEVWFRWLLNCGRSLRHNISPSAGQTTHLLTPVYILTTLISLVGVKKPLNTLLLLLFNRENCVNTSNLWLGDHIVPHSTPILRGRKHKSLIKAYNKFYYDGKQRHFNRVKLKSYNLSTYFSLCNQILHFLFIVRLFIWDNGH